MLNSLMAASNIVSYVLIGVMVLVLVVSMILMNRRSKKRQQEAQDLIDAVKPGNKVKTIGGICGIVVEVDPEDDSFVLETGSEASGKCYIKFVRQAIYESDAKLEKDVKTEKPENETAGETESAETAEQPAAEEPAVEAAAEEEGADKE